MVPTPVASTTISPCTVSTGAMVSFTIIFCTAEVTFPTLSFAFHVTGVIPTGKPSDGASFVNSTSDISLTVATPMSKGVFTAVASTVISLGGYTTGFVLSIFTEVLFCALIFPTLSTAQ